jgi:integrase
MTEGVTPSPTPSKKKRKSVPPPTIRNLKLYPVVIGGKTRYRVTSPLPGGGRKVKTYTDKGEAQSAYELACVEALNYGASAFSLPEDLRRDAQRAHALLAPHGVSLLTAAEFYVAHRKTTDASVTVKAAIEELKAARKADGMRARYLGDLRARLERFNVAFGERNMATLSTAEIDDWLRGLAVSAVTRNTYRRRLQTLFNFARGRGWAVFNPVDATTKLKEANTEPGILKPEQLARLLDTASPKTLPYWALGAFCGLRSAELARLEWEDVSFLHKHVEVPANKSKTGRERRLIPLRANLERWLEPFRSRTGPITPINLRKLLDADRARAGLSFWPANGLRHSFASYHLARFRNAPSLALELGHRNPDILFAHYRSLVTSKAAAKYWSIMPKSKNISHLPPKNADDTKIVAFAS